MANRPKLGKITRELAEVKNELRDFKNEYKDFKSEMKSELKQSKRREVIGLLQQTKIPYSSNYAYTYEEIAHFIGISTTEVANIAKEEGLARRLNSREA